MEITKTEIEGLLILQPKIWRDERGYFFESYSKVKFSDLGINIEFVQDNQSFSKKGTLRGLHYQNPPFAQTKLVRVLEGEIIDLEFELKKSKVSCGKWLVKI